MAFVGCGTLFVERIERMPDRSISQPSSSGNNACVTTASIAVAPDAASALAQAIRVPPDEHDIIDDQGGTAGNTRRLREVKLDGAVACTALLRHRRGQSKAAGEIGYPRLRFRIRSDDDGRGINPGFAQFVCDGRHRRQIVGFDSRKYCSDLRRPMEMRVDSDHAIHARCEQRADNVLADRFAFMERGVLAHVAKIGRKEDEAPGTTAPQRFGCEQKSDEFFVGSVE
ncbi:hypothetical protein ACVWY2_000079 [Bradyrhizobium sp. JR6.1]